MNQIKGTPVFCRERRVSPWYSRTSSASGAWCRIFCMFQLRNSSISTLSWWACDNPHKIKPVSVFLLKSLPIWHHLLQQEEHGVVSWPQQANGSRELTGEKKPTSLLSGKTTVVVHASSGRGYFRGTRRQDTELLVSVVCANARQKRGRSIHNLVNKINFKR